MLVNGFDCTNVKKSEISIGINVEIKRNVHLIGFSDENKSIEIGDNVYIGENSKIIANNIRIMDYTKIHNHCFIYAPRPISIGYNCWVGQNTILNAEEELIIHNNVCIGAYSQLWTHIKFGDTLEGCRFHSYKKMVIEDDVWFAPHCIVSPINAKKKSMALAGSVIVKDMRENHIYAGVPGKDITDKIGNQFIEISVKEKFEKMRRYLDHFLTIWNNQNTIRIVTEYPKDLETDLSYFNVKDRTYTKRNSEIEHKFMEFLLPEKGKFIPRGNK